VTGGVTYYFGANSYGGNAGIRSFYAELLGHLRGQGVHVRGCWAVDLLLGKV
jgi:hypothetical protein